MSAAEIRARLENQGLPPQADQASFEESAAFANRAAAISRKIANALITEFDRDTLARQISGYAQELLDASADPAGIKPGAEHGDPRDADGPTQKVVGYDITPASGLRNPLAPPFLVHKDHENGAAEATVTMPEQYVGPPTRVHGGMVALLLDHVMGNAQSTGGRAPGFTAQLNITYRAGTPLGEELTVCAWIEKEEGRKRFVRGEVRTGGAVTAEAEGLWVVPRELAYV